MHNRCDTKKCANHSTLLVAGIFIHTHIYCNGHGNHTPHSDERTDDEWWSCVPLTAAIEWLDRPVTDTLR